MLYGYTNGFTYSPNVVDGGFLTDPGVPTPGETAVAIARAAPPLTLETIRAGGNEEITANIQAGVRGARNAASAFIPKTVSLSLQFNVLHTHLMGFGPTNGTSFESFGGSDFAGLDFPYMPNVAIDPASGVAPGDELFNAAGESVGFTNDTLRNLAPEVDAAQSEALE